MKERLVALQVLRRGRSRVAVRLALHCRGRRVRRAAQSRSAATKGRVVYVTAPDSVDDDDAHEAGWRRELRVGRRSHHLRAVLVVLLPAPASGAEKGTAWARGRSVVSRVCARNAEMRKNACALYHLCRGHDSWRAWSLGVTARGFETHVQGSYYSLQWGARPWESGPTGCRTSRLVARGGNGRAKARVASERSSAGSASSCHSASDILRRLDRDGARMCDRVFGRERGDVAFRSAAWERNGSR